MTVHLHTCRFEVAEVDDPIVPGAKFLLEASGVVVHDFGWMFDGGRVLGWLRYEASAVQRAQTDAVLAGYVGTRVEHGDVSPQ